MHVSWMWVLGGVLIAVWLAVIVSLVWLFVTRPAPRPRVPTDRARTMLAERYISGEIDEDEYLERLGTGRQAAASHQATTRAA